MLRQIQIVNGRFYAIFYHVLHIALCHRIQFFCLIIGFHGIPYIFFRHRNIMLCKLLTEFSCKYFTARNLR